MTDTNLAQDQLKEFVRRVESVEDEIDALNADKSEIYKEAKSAGFNVKQLRKVIQKRRLPADERMEQDAVFELYWDAVHGAAAEGDSARAHARVENIEKFPTGSKVEALKADPDLHIVDVANLKNKSENQPSPKAGRDLTVPPSPQGRVAPIQPETVNEARQADKQVEALASADPAPVYPAPGEVYWENIPRRPVHRHEYSAAFGDLGQDHYVIKDGISCARSAPIVMMGDVILDGWARYNCARCMVGLDGQTAQYPAVQYDGSDPLIDCIKLNVEGRILDESQKRIIAAKLTGLEPSRKDDIYKAFELWMEPV